MLHRALQSFRQSCIHSCLCQHFRIQSSLWRRFGRGFIGLSAWHGVGRRQLAAVAVRYKHAAVHTEGSGHIVRGPVICLLAHRFVWCISWCVCVCVVCQSSLLASTFSFRSPTFSDLLAAGLEYVPSISSFVVFAGGNSTTQGKLYKFPEEAAVTELKLTPITPRKNVGSAAGYSCACSPHYHP